MAKNRCVSFINGFTEKELFEIEKVFDRVAGQHQVASARVIYEFGMAQDRIKNEKLAKHISKVIEEDVGCWDVYRTISAKAQQLRVNGGV